VTHYFWSTLHFGFRSKEVVEKETVILLSYKILVGLLERSGRV